MSGLIGALRVTLGMDSAAFTQGMTKAQREAAKSSSAIQKSLGGIKSGLASLGLGISAGLFLSAARGALQFADDLSAAADKAGVAVERYQTLTQGLRAMEISQEQADKSLKSLSDTLGNVLNHQSNAATKALDRLGVSSQILSGQIKDPAQLLDALAASAKKAGSQSQFTADLVDVLGKKIGVDMAAALRDGGAALHKIEEEFRRSGLVIDAQMIAKLADANEAIEAFQVKAQRVFVLALAETIQFAGDFGTAIDATSGVFDGPVTNWSNTIGNFFDGARRDIVTFAKEIDDALNRLRFVREGEFSIAGALGWSSGRSNIAGPLEQSFKTSSTDRFLANLMAPALRPKASERTAAVGGGGKTKASKGGSRTAKAKPPTQEEWFQSLSAAERYLQLAREMDVPINMGMPFSDTPIVDLEKLGAEASKMVDAFAAMELPDFSKMTSSETLERMELLGDELSTIAEDALGGLFGINDITFDGLIKQLQRVVIQLLVIEPIVDKLRKSVGGLGSGGGLIAGILRGLTGGVGSTRPLSLGDGFSTAVGNPGATSLGSALAGLPKFATGGSFTLGGMAGLDTNLLSLNGQGIAAVSRGEHVAISPNNEGRRGMYFDLRGAVMTQDLLAQMSRIGNVSSYTGAVMGSAGAQSAMARRSARRIP